MALFKLRIAINHMNTFEYYVRAKSARAAIDKGYKQTSIDAKGYNFDGYTLLSLERIADRVL